MCFDHFVDINGFDKGNNIPGFKEEYKNEIKGSGWGGVYQVSEIFLTLNA